MGKKNEDGSYGQEYVDGIPEETTAHVFVETPAASSSGSSSGLTECLTIEEHAKQENIPAHIFAAVKAMKGWNPGKKVHKSVFNEAVNAFLNAPIGGVQ